MIHIALKDDKSEILVSWSGAIYDALRNYAFLFMWNILVVGQNQSFLIVWLAKTNLFQFSSNDLETFACWGVKESHYTQGL